MKNTVMSRQPSRAVVGLALIAALAGARGFAQQPAPQQPAPQPPATQQPSEVEVVISGDTGAPPRYAVPDFVAMTPDVAEAARTIAQVLWDDLAFERDVYTIPRDTYGSIPAARTPDQIPFASWRELGADAVVFGTVQKNGNNLMVQVRLFSVRTRQSVFAKEYGGSAVNPRQYAHTAADEIHLAQRQLKGVARTKLAFVSDRTRERMAGTVQNRDVKEIWVSDYDGANQRRITVSRDLNLNPAWTADARGLAYTSYRRVSTGGEPDIFLSRIYQGLLENPTKAQGSNFTPAYSPDGTRIAFSSNRDGNSEIYVMNSNGTDLRRVTNHPAGDIAPTWSPTGAQLAFVSDRTGAGRPQIYIVNVDGTGLRHLPLNDGWVDGPTWAPAPYNEIAYTARTGGAFDIKVYELATGAIRAVTFGEGANESPSYSPTGRHIAFHSSRAGRSQIFTIGRDGRGLKQITREGNNQTPAWSN
jgi:TolB protein